jgi:hypothetical protein
MVPAFMFNAAKSSAAISRHLTAAGLGASCRIQGWLAKIVSDAADLVCFSDLRPLYAIVVLRHSLARLPLREDKLAAFFQRGAHLVYVGLFDGMLG